MNQVTKISGQPLANIEAEQQLLGALLLDVTRMEKLGEMASPDLFFDPAHREIFRAIERRYKADEMVSPVALKNYADSDPTLEGLGGSRYLVRLAGSSVSSDAVRHYAEILREYRAKRSLQDAMREATELLQDDATKASDVAGRMEAALVANVSREGEGPVSMMKAVTGAMQEVYDIYEGKETPGVRTGIHSLDKFFGKLTPGQLILLGGRPSMGKSAVALGMALNVARAGGGVALATLEMTPESMAQRAISEATARQRHAIAYSDMGMPLTEAQMRAASAAAREVANLPIHFLPTNFRDTGALYAGAKRIKSLLGETCGLKLLVVDYLQLLQADGRSRVEQITQISIALKALAMQLQVPVLALSQLSRALESREDKRPQLSDLRESGQLEQDADAVLFCYRGEYYLERDKPEDDDLEAVAAWQDAMEKANNRLEIIVAKQRQGAIGTAKVRFNPALNLIWEDGF